MYKKFLLVDTMSLGTHNEEEEDATLQQDLVVVELSSGAVSNETSFNVESVHML